MNKKLDVFEIKKSNVLGQIKPRFSFCLKINFRKMASNKHVDLRINKKTLLEVNAILKTYISKTLLPWQSFLH